MHLTVIFLQSRQSKNESSNKHPNVAPSSSFQHEKHLTRDHLHKRATPANYRHAQKSLQPRSDMAEVYSDCFSSFYMRLLRRIHGNEELSFPLLRNSSEFLVRKRATNGSRMCLLRAVVKSARSHVQGGTVRDRNKVTTITHDRDLTL